MTMKNKTQGRILCLNGSKGGGIFLVFCLAFGIFSAEAQKEPEPFPPDALLKGILDFHEPTALRGRLLYINKKEQIIWLDWAQVSEDWPSFEKGWKLVPGEWRVALYPFNQAQFYDLQQLPRETAIELVIQLDHEGHRRILSFQKLAHLPKVYSKLSLP